LWVPFRKRSEISPGLFRTPLLESPKARGCRRGPRRPWGRSGSISRRILLELKGSVEKQFQTIRDVRGLLSRSLEGFDEIAAISDETKGHIRAVREGSESLGQAVDQFQV
jgi:hypothetical protein